MADNILVNSYDKPRQLNSEEIAKLLSDTTLVSSYRQNKLEKDAKKNWDLFYKRNSTKFFRDRHWTTREFQELIDGKVVSDNNEEVNLLECGCGVGNFVWPLIEQNTTFNIYLCDFSPIAIDLVKSNPLFSEHKHKCHAFVADITSESGIVGCVPNSVKFDIITLVFVLSSIHPNKMKTVIKNIYELLRPNGVLLFRDYGLYDYAMLRFSAGHKLDDNFYARQDGTRAYYFSLEFVDSLLTSCGFQVISNSYIKRETVNPKEGLCVPRIFVQSKFRKCTNSNSNSN